MFDPRALSSLCLVLLLAGVARGQGADDCFNAQAISGDGVWSFQNTFALMDGSPEGLCDFGGSQDITHDVWFEYTSTETGTHILSVCGLSSVDTKIAVYAGDCAGSVLACDDDSCGTQSELSWEAIGGAVYVLRVGTPSGAAGGTGQFAISFVPDPLGENYCTAAANSTGSGAVMSASGSVDITLNNLILSTEPVPNGQMGLFFYGAAQVSAPFGNGIQCVGSGGLGLFRLGPPVPSGTVGVMSKAVDFTAMTQPAGVITLGSTWNFQCWYRDPAAGGSTFNLSDGYRIVFAPGGGAYGGMALIPGGSFEMGRHVGSGSSNELPVHTVALDAFYMDVYEVTTQQYAEYLTSAYAQAEVTVTSNVVYQVGGAGQALCDTEASSTYSHIVFNSSTQSFGVTAGWEDQPMVVVSWFGACTYANHRSAQSFLTPCYDETSWACDFSASGYRLPTEAEWEYAARGGAHSPYTVYPWGDSIDGSMANSGGSGDPYEGRTPPTTPVGYYDGNQTPGGVDMANGYGLYDTSGNVWEWGWDWYDGAYYSSSPGVNPTGPTTGSYRAQRGGGWAGSASSLRSANRNNTYPTNRDSDGGFRVLAAR
jgi:formylglycine-generating enzyme required for sulfatase activity